MLDHWVASHLITRSLGAAAASFTLTPRPYRWAVGVIGASYVNVSSDRGFLITALISEQRNNTFTTSTTTQVPPGTDTGSISVSSTAFNNGSWLLTARDYGSVLAGGLTLGSVSGTFSAIEIFPDTVLAQKLSDLDRLEGWPLFGSPR